MPPSAVGWGGRPGSPPALPAHSLQPAPTAPQLPPGPGAHRPGPRLAAQRLRHPRRGAGTVEAVEGPAGRHLGDHGAGSGYCGDRQRRGGSGRRDVPMAE